MLSLRVAVYIRHNTKPSSQPGIVGRGLLWDSKSPEPLTPAGSINFSSIETSPDCGHNRGARPETYYADYPHGMYSEGMSPLCQYPRQNSLERSLITVK